MREEAGRSACWANCRSLTDTGTFIVNGTERASSSRSCIAAGCVLRPRPRGKTPHNSNEAAFHTPARVIPYRGSWLDFSSAEGRAVPYRRRHQAAGDGAAARAQLHQRGSARHLASRTCSISAKEGTARRSEARRRAPARRDAELRPARQRRRAGRTGKRITARHVRPARQRQDQSSKCRTGTCSAASSRTTSSTPRRASCSPRPTTRDQRRTWRRSARPARRRSRRFISQRPRSRRLHLRPCASIRRAHAAGGAGRDLHDAPRRAPTKDAAQNLFKNLFFSMSATASIASAA